MSTNTKCIFSFAVGAAIGAAVTWKFLKTKYELLAQEEIDSVKEAFSRVDGDYSKSKPFGEVEECDAETLDFKEHAAILRNRERTDYTAFSREENDTQKEEKQEMDKPYVISPDEFGEFYDYEKIDLTYYADGVLADENDDIVDDADNTVGSDFADHFGDYEEDIVHIRNDKLKCDYEIAVDHRKYVDVTHTMPHRVED